MSAQVAANLEIYTEVVNVTIARKPYGWFVAESRDLPGLFVSHPTLEQVVKDIPAIIKALYKHNRNMDVVAIQAGNPPSPAEDAEIRPWVTLPAHIADRTVQGH
jgi:hypothetical protein